MFKDLYFTFTPMAVDEVICTYTIISFCNCSRDFPLVSGITFMTKNNCKIIAMVKNEKAIVPPELNSATLGKVHVIRAAHTQWVRLPKTCPFALTALGNISDRKTQITAPCEKAKKAINPIIKINTEYPVKF